MVPETRGDSCVYSPKRISQQGGLRGPLSQLLTCWGFLLLDAAQWVKASLNGWLARLCQPPGPKAQVTKPGGSNKPVH